MKQILIIVLIAAVVSGVVVQAYRMTGAADPSGSAPAPAALPADAVQPLALSFTDALPEDVWVDGSRGAGDDHRSLTAADNSICFITKFEISGVQAADAASSCSMQIDDFTGFWDLAATVEQGSQSHIRCNARCLVWE